MNATGSLMNEIILRGGTACLDPALYDDRVAGFGSSVFDLIWETPQPAGWRFGCPPNWCEIWLGVE